MKRCGDGLILIRGQGAGAANPNFFYLTGIAQAQGALVLAPGGARIGVGRMYPGPDYIRGTMAREILFLPSSDPLLARWGEDSASTVTSVRAERLGVDAVLGIGELEAVLERNAPAAGVLHYVRGFPASLVAERDDDAAYVSRVRERFFGLRVADATPHVHEQRRKKDAHEVRALERAAAVTAEAVSRALAMVRPGIPECEIEAEITRVYRSHGARHAFDPIVAAGRNALSLHYMENRGRTADGELLLVDTGASLEGYKADVTRTVPVNGRFSQRQREVYEVVLRALLEATALCRPGVLLGDVHARAFDVIDRAGFGAHFVHGTSHHLGLETHDVGDVHRPLEVGCYVTVEPGIYLGDEGLGVRLEDDVLVTESGPRVLTETIPRAAEAVERAVAHAS
jgi:Xaa-Pro aminopeptidase